MSIVCSVSTEEDAFPGRTNSTQIINRILKLADEYQVKAIPLATRQWSVEKAGKGYLSFGLQLTVQGRFDRFVDFMNKLENEEFDTIVVESLSVTRVTSKAEGKALPYTTPPVKANLDVAIYALGATDD